jgi:hypothetical protein
VISSELVARTTTPQAETKPVEAEGNSLKFRSTLLTDFSTLAAKRQISMCQGTQARTFCLSDSNSTRLFSGSAAALQGAVLKLGWGGILVRKPPVEMQGADVIMKNKSLKAAFDKKWRNTQPSLVTVHQN